MFVAPSRNDRDPRCIVFELRLIGAIRTRDAELALLLASALAYLDPGDEVASRIKYRCADCLERDLPVEFLDMGASPRRAVARKDLESYELSPADLSVFALVDGACTVERIIDSSGMPFLAAYDALETLLAAQALDLGEPPQKSQSRMTTHGNAMTTPSRVEHPLVLANES